MFPGHLARQPLVPRQLAGSPGGCGTRAHASSVGNVTWDPMVCANASLHPLSPLRNGSVSTTTEFLPTTALRQRRGGRIYHQRTILTKIQLNGLEVWYGQHVPAGCYAVAWVPTYQRPGQGFRVLGSGRLQSPTRGDVCVVVMMRW